MPGFPNTFDVLGAHQANGNEPHVIEHAASWISRFIQYIQDHQITYVNANTEEGGVYTNDVLSLTDGSFSAKNSLVDNGCQYQCGKETRKVRYPILGQEHRVS